MKRWAWVVAGLYLLILVALTVPVTALAFAPGAKLSEIAQAFLSWPYWVWLVVMLLSQAALLTVPVQFASHRPIVHRSLFLPILVAGLMMGALLVGALYSIYEFIFRDKGPGNWIWWSAVAAGVLVWCAWTVVFFRLSRGVE